MQSKKINKSSRNLALVFGTSVTAALTAGFIALPVVLQNYNKNSEIQAAIVQASLFASGLTGVATLEIARRLIESSNDEGISQPSNITINNVSNYKNYYNTNIDNRISSPEEIVSLLAQIQDVLMNADLPQSEKEKAIAYLGAAELEVREEEPDKELVAKNLKRMTETLTDSAKTFDAVKSLLPQIVRLLGLSI